MFFVGIVHVLSTCMLLEVLCSDGIDLSDFAHKLDQEAMSLVKNMHDNSGETESDDWQLARRDVSWQISEHHRQRRSTSAIMSMVKSAQKTGNREEIVVNAANVVRTIENLYNPTDIIPMFIKLPDEPYKRLVFFAIANNRRSDGNFSSNVLILRFHEEFGNFSLHQSIPVYAPYKLEAFDAMDENQNDIEFLAVVAYAEGESQPQSAVSMYKMGPSPNYLFSSVTRIDIDNAADIRAMQHFKVSTSTFLAIGRYSIYTPKGVAYSSSTQVSVYRYDPQTTLFVPQTSIPGSGVVDLAAFTIKSELYLAVANYRDDAGSLDIVSYINKYNPVSNTFDLLQFIPTRGARDIEYFVLSEQSYLVVANEAYGNASSKLLASGSDVYKFINNEFANVQTLPTLGALMWRSIAIPNCKNDILLVYGDQRDSVDQVGIFSFSHYQERFNAVQLSLFPPEQFNSSFRPNPSALSSFTTQDQQSGDYSVFLVIGSKNQYVSGAIYQLNHDVRINESPMEGFLRDVSERAKYLNDLLRNLQSVLEATKRRLDGAVTVYDFANMNGTNIFTSLHTKHADVRTLEISTADGSIFLLKNGSLHRADPEEIPNPVSIAELEKQDLSTALLRSEYDRQREQLLNCYNSHTFNGKINFGLVEADSCEISGNLTVGLGISGVNLTTLSSSIIKSSANSTITGQKVFLEPVTARAAFAIGGDVNGINLEHDTVLQGLEQIITGEVVFASNTSINASLRIGLINGVDISSDLAFLNAPATVNGYKHFSSDLELYDAVIEDGRISERNLLNLFSNRVSKTMYQILTGKKTIAGSVVSLENVNLTSINGLNINSLNSDAMKKGSELFIGGSIEFSSEVRLGRDLNGACFVNDLLFPDAFFRKSVPQSVAGSNNMTGLIRMAANLTVEGFVDGVKTNELLTLTQSEEIYGTKIFKSLNTNAISFAANATVNNVNLESFFSQVVRLDTDEDIDFLSFADDITVSFSQTKNLLNNDTAASLLKLLMESLLAFGNQTVLGRKTIPGNAAFNTLHSRTVNSYRLPGNFMGLSTNDVIAAPYSFHSPVTFKRAVTVSGLVDDIDVRSLQGKVVYLNRDQELTGSVVFLGDAYTRKSILLNGLVNGVNVSRDLLTIRTEQVVYGRKAMQAITFNGTQAVFEKDLNVQSTIDGVDLSEFATATVTLSKDEVISGSFVFGANNVDRYFRLFDIVSLKSDLVTQDTEQELTSAKIFNSLVIPDDLSVSSTVDGVDVSTFYEDVLSSRNVSQLSGEIVMHSLHVRGSVTVGSLLNDVNMSTVEEGLISRSADMKLERVIVRGNLAVNDVSVMRLNSLNLSSDVVYRSVSQAVSGIKSFTQPVSISNFSKPGSIDGVDLEELINTAVFREKDQTIHGVLTFDRDVLVQGNVVSYGLTDGIDLSSWDLVRTRAQEQLVQGTKTFASRVDMMNVSVSGTVNGVNFYSFLNDMVHVHGDETINGHIRFLDGLTSISALDVAGNLTISSNTINGIDIVQISEDVLFILGDQELSGLSVMGNVLMQELTVGGLINGLNLSTDVVTTQGFQAISGKKTFHTVTALHVNVYGLVNGLNVTDIERTTLVSASAVEQIFQAEKSFSILTMSAVDVAGTVDGLTLRPGRLVTLSTNQEITGNWTFVTSLLIKGQLEVKGKLDGVNLDWFSSNRVSLSTNQNISSPLLFSGDVYINGDLINSGKINGMDISQFDLKAPSNQPDLLVKKDQVNNTLTRQCRALSYVQKSVAASPYRFDRLTEYQLLSSMPTKAMEYLEVGGEKYLGVVTQSSGEQACSTSKLLKRNSTTGLYDFYQDLLTSGTQKLISFTAPWNATYLVAVNSNQSCSSVKGSSSLLVWNPAAAAFQVQHVLNDSAATDGDVTVNQGIVYIFLSTTLSRTHTWALHMYGLTALSNLAVQTPGSAVESFLLTDNLFYALAWQPMEGTSRGYVAISSIRGQASEIIQQIPTIGASSMTTFTNYGQFYLVIANREDRSTDGHSSYDVSVEVYIYVNATNAFAWFQSIPSSPSIHVEAFHVGKTAYLALTRVDQRLVIYEFGLEIGFNEIYSMSVGYLQSARSFSADGEFFLAVSAGSASLSTSTFVDTKLLKLEALGVATDRLRDISLKC